MSPTSRPRPPRGTPPSPRSRPRALVAGAPPADLDAQLFELGGGQVAVLSFKAVPGTELTAAEAEVVALVLGGLSNKEIAARRGVTVRTVANQIASIFRKLEISSRAELAARVAI